MWYLYLDESGDLGFDFANKKPSNFFTVTILVVKGMENNRALIKAVRKTITRKLNPRSKSHRIVPELKGYGTSIEVKKYFYQQAAKISFDLFSVSLNKRQTGDELPDEAHRIYNYISRLVLDAIPLENAQTRIKLIIDKSKNVPQIREFNASVINQLLGKIDPKIPIDIHHRSSVEENGLQAVDIFSYGIYRKYECGDSEWFDIFSDRVQHDQQYPLK
jgi:hypothetical protein